MTDSKTMVPVALSARLVLGLMDQALAHARLLGVHISVAVNDSTARLIAFLAEPQIMPAAYEMAKAKAFTAAYFRRPTLDLGRGVEGKPAAQASLVSIGKVVLVGGGLPIVVGGQPAGGIGVSGATEAQDIACAEAALKWLQEQSGA